MADKELIEEAKRIRNKVVRHYILKFMEAGDKDAVLDQIALRFLCHLAGFKNAIEDKEESIGVRATAAYLFTRMLHSRNNSFPSFQPDIDFYHTLIDHEEDMIREGTLMGLHESHQFDLMKTFLKDNSAYIRDTTRELLND